MDLILLTGVHSEGVYSEGVQTKNQMKWSLGGACRLLVNATSNLKGAIRVTCERPTPA